MKYQLSSLKHKLNTLGVFNIRFLEAINSDYTNDFDLKANQWVGGSEIIHKINALTFHDALMTLINRAEAFKETMESVRPTPYASPDTASKNMVGHLKDESVDLVQDVGI